MNDTWVISGIAPYEIARVVIWNRWGQKVFVSTGYEEPWDGTRAGSPVPAATYYYIITFEEGQNHDGKISGYVAIVR